VLRLGDGNDRADGGVRLAKAMELAVWPLRCRRWQRDRRHQSCDRAQTPDVDRPPTARCFGGLV